MDGCHLARVAAGLLNISRRLRAPDGLPSTRSSRSYHLPERSLIYLLHAILEQERGSPGRMLASPEWRMYLMRPGDLETAVLRLHQFRALDYQVAGSLVQLTLPCDSSGAYAEKMVA